MQFYAIKNRLPLKTVLFLAIVLFIAYLPVSSFLFFIKNDAFTGYFPPKFFMSESLHAGHLPLWNPYINFGIPQYGDMSSGYWSPITWLIAGTVGYNAYSFTIEILLYILIGGVGMYRLSGIFQTDKMVSLMAAVAFMCCGYNIAHLQHVNWLSGAAFLPCCYWSYQLLLQHATLKNIIRAVLLFYLLVASAHPGITISAAYFFSACFLFDFLQNSRNNQIGYRLKQALTTHAIFAVLFTMVAAGLIIGYLDILPHFGRGEKISLEDSLLHPASPQSWISVLLPFSTVKNDAFFNTDISMRNNYFSSTMLLFFLVGIFSKKTKQQVFLLICGLVFLLLSTGGIFKVFAYKFMPLMGYVRLNGEFSIFALMCFILFAAIELNKQVAENRPFTGRIKQVLFALKIITIALIAGGLYNSFSNQESIIYTFSNIRSQTGITGKLKFLVDAVQFYDCLWIQGILQLLLLWGISWCLKFNNWRLLVTIVVVDMVLASLMNIPFTGAGKASVSAVQQVLNKSPKGIPIPKLIPINQLDTISSPEQSMVGDWSFYSKQPGSVRQALYPIVLKNTAAYFDQQEINAQLSLAGKPLLFTARIISDSMAYSPFNNVEPVLPGPAISNFKADQITVDVSTSQSTNLVYLQNYYPHWFYADGVKKSPVKKAGINFMAAPLNKGANKIIFTFEPTAVKIGMLVSLISFILLLLIMLLLPVKPTRSFPS